MPCEAEPASDCIPIDLFAYLVELRYGAPLNLTSGECLIKG